MAGENITAGFVIPTVASCVDVVVHLALQPDGRRRVAEIITVSDRVEGGVIASESVGDWWAS